MQMADLFSGDNRYKTAMAMSGIGSALRGQDASPMLQQIMMYDMMQREKAQEAEQKKQADALLSSIFGGQPAGQMMPARTGPPQMSGGSTPKGVATDAMTALGKKTGGNGYREAIASIESKGSGGYNAVGPTHPKLGRALGRYQIMEANIGPWSREVLGREVTPEQFLSTPQIQDAIFDAKFGKYVEQYGPQGAAQAWFGGPGGVGKLNRTDSLGTSIGEYTNKFNAALGGVQTAQSGGITRDQVLAVMRNPQIDSGTKQFVLGEYKRQNAQPEDDRTSLRKNVEWLMSQGIPRDQALQMARGGVQVTNNMGDTGINYGDPGKGLVWQRDPQGKVVTDDRGAPIAIPYQGGDVWQKQQAQEEAAANVDARKKTTAGVVLDDVRRIREKVTSDTEIPIFGSTTTGVAGGLLSKVDSTEAGAVRNMLDTVRANIGFDKLQSMREESPTGGAVGQVSNLENRLMQATYGALIQSQGKEQFLYNLDRVEDIYNRIIHQGIPDQEAEKLLSGFGIGAADPLGIR